MGYNSIVSLLLARIDASFANKDHPVNTYEEFDEEVAKQHQGFVTSFNKNMGTKTPKRMMREKMNCHGVMHGGMKKSLDSSTQLTSGYNIHILGVTHTMFSY